MTGASVTGTAGGEGHLGDVHVEAQVDELLHDPPVGPTHLLVVDQGDVHAASSSAALRRGDASEDS